jgi:hypothetical protein
MSCAENVPLVSVPLLALCAAGGPSADGSLVTVTSNEAPLMTDSTKRGLLDSIDKPLKTSVLLSAELTDEV